PFVVVTQLSRRVVCNEHVSFGFHWRQQAIAFFVYALITLPRDAVIAFAIGREVQLCNPVAIGLQCLREDVVVLMPAKLQTPTPLASACDRRKYFRALLQLPQ